MSEEGLGSSLLCDSVSLSTSLSLGSSSVQCWSRADDTLTGPVKGWAHSGPTGRLAQLQLCPNCFCLPTGLSWARLPGEQI